jgi:hypothetical protein
MQSSRCVSAPPESESSRLSSSVAGAKVRHHAVSISDSLIALQTSWNCNWQLLMALVGLAWPCRRFAALRHARHLCCWHVCRCLMHLQQQQHLQDALWARLRLTRPPHVTQTKRATAHARQCLQGLCWTHHHPSGRSWPHTRCAGIVGDYAPASIITQHCHILPLHSPAGTSTATNSSSTTSVNNTFSLQDLHSHGTTCSNKPASLLCMVVCNSGM